MSQKTRQSLKGRHLLVRDRRLPLPLIVILAMLVLVAVGFLAFSSRAVTNYIDPDGPKFEGSYAFEQSPFDGDLKVVTWNIAFAREIEQAIAELRETEELQDADVLILQEMDEAGTEAIAQALGYNYVYYPASIHSRHGKNFGNAVLSRWPIIDSAKIILPHNNPSNDQIRIATRATIDVDGRHIPVYSVHTETFWLIPERRKDQIAALAEDIGSTLAQDLDYAIIGGDFNTITSDSLAALTSRMEEVGLVWVSQGAGKTVDKAGIGASLDHILAKNMTPLSTGVVAETEASDHLPVWVILALDPLLEDSG